MNDSDSLTEPRAEIARLVSVGDELEIVAAPGWLGPALQSRATGVFPAKPVARLLVVEPTWTLSELELVLAQFAKWPEASRLMLGFPNGGSASRLTGLLAGTARGPAGWPDDQVRQLVEAGGLGIVERKAFRARGASTLAQPTDEALRGLFTQLNSSAGDDWLLYTLSPRAEKAAPGPLVKGLLSVVMRNHSTSRMGLFDHAVFSLAAQHYRQLEIVLVTQATNADAVSLFEAVLERHQPLGKYTFRVIAQPSTRDIRARLVNIGIDAARGQYLAILDDDDVVYPHHYTRLIDALQGSTEAWAFAPIQRAYYSGTPNGDLYCLRKSPMPYSDEFSLAQLAYDNYVTCHSYVIDRARLGQYQVRFEERLDKGEDYAMLLKLLATFHPLAVGGGVSAEYRIRDDGSNTIIHETSNDVVAARLRREWEAAIKLKNRLTDPLQMLMSKATFVTESFKGLRPSELDAPLRHDLADRANEMIKRRLPFLHARLRRVAAPKLKPVPAEASGDEDPSSGG